MKPDPQPEQQLPDSLQVIAAWFAQHEWQPFPFQWDVWAAYLRGASGLIHAPTGTGKTYAVWMGALAEWLAENAGEAAQEPALRVLWITPLRALAADTARSLRLPLDELHVPWRVETRTSDTSSATRSRQARRLPSALITTPESLSVLLARPNAQTLFSHLRLVVLDEWHELMASKRGVQTELGLARLRRWNPALRTWGLSATMSNLDTAMQALLGVGPRPPEAPHPRLVQGLLPKQVEIVSLLPEVMERFPWAGHLGLRLLPQVIAEIESGQSALLFTNTRSQTERWYQALLDARPEWAGEIALHHGSLDREVRNWVEEALRSGRLRCVVATSSLDLGVDFSPVDRVFQVGSPKGVARLLQRAGRSGHQPGAVSRVICVPTHAFELVEVAAARDAALAGQIEPRPPIEKPLDVLAQHLVTIALGGGFEAEALFQEVRTAYAYRDLSRLEWDWALNFVTQGGPALKAYAQYRKVERQEGRYVVSDRQIAHLHRMSIGTITDNPTLRVKYLKGPNVGHIDEGFASRLKRGDRFTLGGKVLEFVRLKDMTVWVRRAKGRRGVIPRWLGGGLPLSETLTSAVRARLDAARRGEFKGTEMQAVRPILELQARWSALPALGELLIERVKTREGYHLFFFPFAGNAVHEGLSALFAFRLSRLQPITFTLAANDYGFELLSPDPAPLEAALQAGLLSPHGLADDIIASLNAAEMARRQFREIARIAGLVYTRFPGGQMSARQLQSSSGLLFDVLSGYDPDNLLLEQARREVLDRQLEHSRLQQTLQRLHNSRTVLKDVPRLTPLAFPLLADRMRQTVSSEKLVERIQRLQLRLERAAGPA